MKPKYLRVQDVKISLKSVKRLKANQNAFCKHEEGFPEYQQLEKFCS